MSKPFNLHDLSVEVVGDSSTFVCNHKPGVAFIVRGEDILFSRDTNFSMYSLALLIPFFPAKQRLTDENDWMTTEELIACNDVNCGAQFRITRTGKSEFTNEEATKQKKDRS